ncbi:isochorismate synthase [Crocosphaera chwakensis]|uniref:isochorismate synthase n=1 Tax=Crocosphaera chwakensis CCY0110 TaxID=391612 RepID=A3IWL2_9CHRO|nr:isochorismate synthase [Crocosphaera chwakensis]EAZ89123.1 menaquinone-specific isochorismate synthase [Crocosphaera chwakensis CCY0110]
MSVATPIIPETTNIGYDQHRLEQLLLTHKATLNRKKQSIIVSLSQITPKIDPLSILAFLNCEKINNFSKDEIYFYWENQGKTEAILGYGVTESCQLNTSDRFIKSQNFVKNCFEKIVKINEHHSSNSFPHIFCGFTFFSETNQLEFPFSSAFTFLPKLQVIKQKRNSLLIFNLLIDSKTDIKKLAYQTSTNIKLISQIKIDPKISNLEKKSIETTPKFQMIQGFESSVASALKSIEAKHFQKLVLANALDLTNSQEFSIIECLKNLRKYYPDCYIFAINNGKNNCFVGASPERLINLKNRQLLTDALAGSTSRGKTKLEDYYLAQKLLKSSKERREHQVVIEFIVQRLINLGLIPQISPLKVLKLSNIQHLWTPIYTQLNANIHPLEIVAKLHPTPAVSGFPTGITCQEIKHYETFERGFYAAPLGWIDYNNNSEFIVGIRSALISGNHARLYAGAGIVEGSQPEQELAEIKLKFQGLLKALSYS